MSARAPQRQGSRARSSGGVTPVATRSASSAPVKGRASPPTSHDHQQRKRRTYASLQSGAVRRALMGGAHPVITAGRPVQAPQKRAHRAHHRLDALPPGRSVRRTELHDPGESGAVTLRCDGDPCGWKVGWRLKALGARDSEAITTAAADRSSHPMLRSQRGQPGTRRQHHSFGLEVDVGAVGHEGTVAPLDGINLACCRGSPHRGQGRCERLPQHSATE